MPTATQIKNTEKALREYRKRYLKKEFMDVDESATRIMVNSFLTEVLGFKELEDIKTEYRIRGEYADYVVQLNRKKHFIVEVKSIQIDLSEKHLRQSVNYAANEGIDWIVLLNGRSIELYKVIFGKPIDSKKVFELDLYDLSQIKKATEHIAYLTKKSIQKDELDELWSRVTALAPDNTCKLLYSEEIILFLRRKLKKDTGIYFDVEDIRESLETVLTTTNNFSYRLKRKK